MPSPSSPPSASLPSTMLEESLLVLQETRATWNVQLELGADHRLDEARLHHAVLTCCRRHPMARARLAPTPRGESSYRWDFAEETDVDPFRVWWNARTVLRWTSCGPSCMPH